MKVGLSLGGGGARGYAHFGVIRALNEAGIPIDLINGSSAGAIAGGAYALYTDIDQIMAIIKEVVRSVNVNYFNIFRYPVESQPFLRNWLTNAICDVLALRRSILSHRNNTKALRQIFGEREFADTQIPFSAVAGDLLAGETVVINQGKLVDGILPSISIPGIFPPIERGQQLLVDGFLLANIPVKELREQGADFVIAVELAGPGETTYQNGFDILNCVESAKYRQLNQWQLGAANFHLKVNFPSFNSMSFNNYEIAMKQGYHTAKRLLPKLKRRLEEANG